MLCKFKGSPHWYVRFTAPNGRRICRTTRTADRKLAQEYEIQLKQEVWRACQLGEESPKRWEEAVLPWSQAKKYKPSWRDLRRNLRILNPYLGGKLLKDITAEDIDRIKAERESAGVAPATTNRTLEVLRSVLRMALKRSWIKALPDRIPRRTRRSHPLDHAGRSRPADSGTGKVEADRTARGVGPVQPRDGTARIERHWP